MKSSVLDKQKLLEKLNRVKYVKDKERREEQLGQMNLSGVLLMLTGIDHQFEYTLCCDTTKHLLGYLPEPQDMEIESDEEEE